MPESSFLDVVVYVVLSSPSYVHAEFHESQRMYYNYDTPFPWHIIYKCRLSAAINITGSNFLLLL